MIARVRSLAMELRPPLLDDFGLDAALRAYCTQQARAFGWMLHFTVADGLRRPHRDVEIASFRFVQEALTNVARHANATEVWVTFEESAGELRVGVRDNGTGFDAETIQERVDEESLGLIAIEERVRQVGGRVELDSHPGGGTEIRVSFPLCSSFPEELCIPSATARCAQCHVRRAGY
jgi:two-component system sensor histidine kinase UhpB